MIDRLLTARSSRSNGCFWEGARGWIRPEEAVRAAKYVKTRRVIGMHYDTFPYIEINKEEAIELFESKGIELTLLAIGSSTSI